MTGAYLKDWIKSSGRSREGIADALGVTTTTLFRWFGQERLDKKTVLALAQLECTEEVTAAPGLTEAIGHPGEGEE